MKLTFVGTGVSCAIPVIGHLTTNCACRDAIANPDGPNRRNNVALLISLPFPATQDFFGSDHAQETHRGIPTHSNEREDDVEWHHVLIDCGKTFRDAYLRVLAPMRVRYVDALLLTHGHADAMHCVEELCAMQAEAAAQLDFSHVSSSASSMKAGSRVHPSANDNGAGDEADHEIPRTLRRVPTYLTYGTLEQIEMVSSDLVNASFHLGPAPETSKEYGDVMWETAASVSSFATSNSALTAPLTVMDLFFLNEQKPQRMHVPLGPLTAASRTQGRKDMSSAAVVSADAPPLPFYSFPVEHGPRYISMCFAFGRGIAFHSKQERPSPHHSRPASPVGSCVVYISDVSLIPEASLHFLLDLVSIDVLILDLLAEHGSPSASHYCADEAIPMVVRLAPRKTYFVGMFCSLEHWRTNQHLAEELAQLKATYRHELEKTDGEGKHGPLLEEEKADRAMKQRFVDRVESMELAYDGQQLDIPT